MGNLSAAHKDGDIREQDPALSTVQTAVFAGTAGSKWLVLSGLWHRHGVLLIVRLSLLSVPAAASWGTSSHLLASSHKKSPVHKRFF